MEQNKMREEIVKKVREVCAAQGKSVRQMEEDLNFSVGLVSRWARMSPSIEKVAAVADYLNVSVDCLLGRNSQIGKDTFIGKICDAVMEGKLVWHPCGDKNPFSFPVSKIDELSDVNWECGYCEFGDGYLLLACILDENWEVANLKLYIIPGEQIKPTLQNYEGDELLPVYDLVKQYIIWQEDQVLVDKLKDCFMRDI